LIQELLSQLDWNAIIPALIAYVLGLLGIGGGVAKSMGFSLPSASAAPKSIAAVTAEKVEALNGLEAAHVKLGTPKAEADAILQAAAAKLFITK